MNTYEVHDLRSRETKPVSQSRRDGSGNIGEANAKKKGEDRRMDGERKKERKREEGAHFLTFFMLHASRDHGSGRERKKEREGGGRPAKAPPHHHPTNSSMRPQSAEQGCRRCR